MIKGSVRGVVETRDKLEQVGRDLHGAPVVDAMRSATLLVHNDAKRFAPVDTGRLRASITPEVRTEGPVIVGVVGSNVIYAPYVETGTRPHWPPVEALEVWAQRHGTSAFVVARAIARRGTKGSQYLERAFRANQTQIERLVGNAVATLVNK